jgi:hypothetical protein
MIKLSTVERHVVKHADNPERLQRIWDAIDRLQKPERLWAVMKDTLESIRDREEEIEYWATRSASPLV